jgi:hypothetical protein
LEELDLPPALLMQISALFGLQHAMTFGDQKPIKTRQLLAV